LSERYFALLHGDGATVDNPTGIFREVKTDDSYRTEYLNQKGTWTLDYNLSSYIFDGEPGAEPIPPNKVDQVISSFRDRLRKA